MFRDHQRRFDEGFTTLLARSCVTLGGCDLDKAYAGPKLPQDEDGKYTISLEFIKGMLEWFKEGKTLPRRSARFYPWRIQLNSEVIAPDMSGKSFWEPTSIS